MTTAEEIDLPALAPFDLALTVAALRRRPQSLTDALVDGEFRRVLLLAGEERLLGVRQVSAECVRVRALDGPLVGAACGEAAALVTRMLGLNVDLAPLRALARTEAALGALAEGLGGLKPPRYSSLWVTFASVVPYQQVSLESGVATMNRVIAALGTPHLVDGAVYYGFPTARRVIEVEPDVLRSCGLSTAKVHTLRLIAERILSGELTEEQLASLPNDAAEERLRALPGIGPWSAQLVLLRGLRRLAVFPAGDSGATRNLRLFLGAPPEDVERISAALLERMGAFRGYLYYLLLGRSLVARGLVAPSSA